MITCTRKKVINTKCPKEKPTQMLLEYYSMQWVVISSVELRKVNKHLTYGKMVDTQHT